MSALFKKPKAHRKSFKLNFCDFYDAMFYMSSDISILILFSYFTFRPLNT